MKTINGFAGRRQRQALGKLAFGTKVKISDEQIGGQT
jgi:hypothetical protein